MTETNKKKEKRLTRIYTKSKGMQNEFSDFCSFWFLMRKDNLGRATLPMTIIWPVSRRRRFTAALQEHVGVGVNVRPSKLSDMGSTKDYGFKKSHPTDICFKCFMHSSKSYFGANSKALSDFKTVTQLNDRLLLLFFKWELHFLSFHFCPSIVFFCDGKKNRKRQQSVGN